MKYLLDTHVFIWSFSDSEKLSKKASKILRDPDNEIFVSAVSLWEISIKAKIGKLELNGFAITELLRTIEKLNYEILSADGSDAIAYYSMKENSHKDPFDRMIVQQCINRNMTLLSKDRLLKKFVQYGLRLV